MTRAQQPPRHRGIVAVALTTWMALSATAPSPASTVVPMSLNELTEAAQLIVDGTVSDVRHVVGASGAERMVLIRVASTWKGDPAASIYVRLAGGTVGRYETRVPGVPRVEVGERLVWFLTSTSGSTPVVVGLHQGVMRVSEAPDGEAMVVSPSRAVADSTRGDRRRVPRQLTHVAADVRRLVARGAAQ